MSVRLYVGNLPQSFDNQELDALFASVGEGIRFKAVQDRETGAGRGFGFANVDDEKVADAVIEQLNGREFAGNALRIERSERRDDRRGNDRRPGSAMAAPYIWNTSTASTSSISGTRPSGGTSSPRGCRPPASASRSTRGRSPPESRRFAVARGQRA